MESWFTPSALHAAAAIVGAVANVLRAIQGPQGCRCAGEWRWRASRAKVAVQPGSRVRGRRTLHGQD